MLSHFGRVCCVGQHRGMIHTMVRKSVVKHCKGALKAYLGGKGLTLSRLGALLVRFLSLAIHIPHNNGAINTIQSGKVVVNVLAMHCAL